METAKEPITFSLEQASFGAINSPVFVQSVLHDVNETSKKSPETTVFSVGLI